MFVIGSNGSGAQHDNWQKNLQFAIQIQEKANELYPGLFKPIILRNSRYNQQLANGASIIEVGATGNTLDQCLVSMKYLARVLKEIQKFKAEYFLKRRRKVSKKLLKLKKYVE